MPAPTHCNELVINYKQMCRSRLAHLQGENTMPSNIMTTNAAENDMDVISIDTDDE